MKVSLKEFFKEFFNENKISKDKKEFIINTSLKNTRKIVGNLNNFFPNVEIFSDKLIDKITDITTSDVKIINWEVLSDTIKANLDIEVESPIDNKNIKKLFSFKKKIGSEGDSDIYLDKNVVIINFEFDYYLLFKNYNESLKFLNKLLRRFK